MSIDERLGAMTPQELTNLLDNAKRLSEGAAGKQQIEAERLVPLIVAEIAARKAAAPPRAKSTTARKKVVKAEAKAE